MKKITALLMTAALIACLLSGCSGERTADTRTEEPVIVSIDGATEAPTNVPSAVPTELRTSEPTPESTGAPIETPTNEPEPTAEPTAVPTSAPAASPMQNDPPEPHHTTLTEAELGLLVNFYHRLPDGYAPNDLVNAKELLGSSGTVKSESIRIQYEVGVQLKRMFESAYADGITCRYRINSAYRSMRKQWEMWNKKLTEDPHYADDPYTNPVGTMPGDASEHVAGLAVDLASTDFPWENAAFGDTAEGIWLHNNSWRFGFILRYPADKTHITGVKSEPWHFRYVGEKLAQAIYESGLCMEEYFGDR